MFYDFFYFSENLDFKKFDIPNLVVGYCEGTLRSSKLQTMRLHGVARILLVSEM